MNGITASLQSFLQQRFQLTPTTTLRDDQWFKRVYQHWRRFNKSKELLILTPNVAKDTWAPEALRQSNLLAGFIRQTAAAQTLAVQETTPPPSKDKIFPDAILDGPRLMSRHPNDKFPTLTPPVQRGGWWSASRDPKEHAAIIKDLLEQEQLAALLYVVAKDPSCIKNSVSCLEKAPIRRPVTYQDYGWATIIDEVLLVFFFAVALSSFPENLLTKDETYINWLPFGRLLSEVGPPMRFMEAFKAQSGSKALGSRDDLRPDTDRCIRILAAAHALHTSSGLEEVNWESRINGALLNFVGFEAWNRERQGERYLYCVRNTAKNGEWLARGLKEDDLPLSTGYSDIKDTKPSRPRDPLRLRDPKQVVASEVSEDEAHAELAELEAEEATYGKKRSAKYARRNVD